MALKTAIPVFQPQMRITAADHMNPIRDDIVDLDTRLVTAEANATKGATAYSTTTAANTGNAALGTRMSTVESATTNGTTGNTALGTRMSKVENPDRCILRKTATQSVASGGDTLVTWDTAEKDSNSMRSGSTIVIKTTGEYLVAGAVNMAAVPGANGESIIYLAAGTGFIGDIALTAFGQPTKATGGLGNGLSTAVVRRLTAGTSLSLLVYWDGASGARNLNPSSFGGCTFSVAQVG